MSKRGAQTTSRIRLKPFPAYKDSGIGSLGEIPAHWEVTRIRLSCSRVTDGAHISPDTSSADFPFVSTVDIRRGIIDFDGCLRTSASSYAYMERTGCRPGHNDVLFSKDGTVGATALVTTDREFAVASSLVILSPHHATLNSRWLDYWLNGAFIKDEVEILLSGAALRRISVTKVGRLPLLLPPELDEQCTIVAFLDRETAKIDALVAQKERLIELLQEKSAALITHAVTKGLDSAASMKDSGVEWFGKIPAHWEIAPLKHYILSVPGAIKTGPFGSQLLSTEMEAGDIKVYNQRTVIDRDFDAGDNFVSEDKFGQLVSFVVEPGDILVTTRGTIGRCAIVPDSADTGILHPCLMRIQPDTSKILREFAILLIQDSDLVRTQLALANNATTIDVIYSETMREVIMPKPPVDEQRTIIAAVNRETVRIDSLVAKVHDGIERLKEYRIALISAAVTGRIDVRGKVA